MQDHKYFETCPSSYATIVHSTKCRELQVDLKESLLTEGRRHKARSTPSVLFYLRKHSLGIYLCAKSSEYKAEKE